MPLYHDKVFVGPALSCANLADKKVGMRVPDDLPMYIHLQRKALDTPFFCQEWQAERLWVDVRDSGFHKKQDNKWWLNYHHNRALRHEIFNMPNLIGVHAPNIKIDVLDDNFDQFKKRLSIASIVEAMHFANAIKAKYFVFHLIQVDQWGSGPDFHSYRREILIPDTLRVYAYFAEIYRRYGFQFIPCIEVLEFPKFPATYYEIIQILSTCKMILPNTQLALDVSHLWRSRALILETQKEGFENIRFRSFLEELWDVLSALGAGDIYVFHMGGCWDIRTHEVPGIHHYEDPFETIYRLDCPDYLYDETREMNISRVLDAIIDFCWYHNQPLRLILEIFEREYYVVMKALQEMNWAVHNKLERRWRR